MKEQHEDLMIAEEVILSKIFLIRNKQVMLSHDLASLYQVKTKVLNQQVKRNISKFPERFMFQINSDEYKLLRSHFVTLKRGQHSKYLPYAFTEHGLLMLSSVLNSEIADKVNILIIDTFIKLRELIFQNKEVLNQLQQVQYKLHEHDNQLVLIFEYLKQFEKSKQVQVDQANRKKIGYKI